MGLLKLLIEICSKRKGSEPEINDANPLMHNVPKWSDTL